MRVPPIVKLKACMERSKGLEISGKVKKSAEHNNYFSFSKAYYCLVPQIQGYCCCNNVEIGRAI